MHMQPYMHMSVLQVFKVAKHLGPSVIYFEDAEKVGHCLNLLQIRVATLPCTLQLSSCLSLHQGTSMRAFVMDKRHTEKPGTSAA